MIRITILFLCISCAIAFPSWFHNYVKEHKKQYSVQQMNVAFSVLKPKYEHIQNNQGSLLLRLHRNSDRKRKINRRLHEMKKRASPTSFQDEKKKKLNMPLEFDWKHTRKKTSANSINIILGCCVLQAASWLCGPRRYVLLSNFVFNAFCGFIERRRGLLVLSKTSFLSIYKDLFTGFS